MTDQKIMTAFVDRRSAERAFAASAVLAKTFKAHIDAVHMRQHPPVPTSAYHPFPYAYIPVDMREAEEGEKRLAEELAALFGELCERHEIKRLNVGAHSEGEGATADWSETRGNFPDGLSARARVADLVAVARPDNDSPMFEEQLIEEFIFQSGRPVLISDGASRSFTNTVVVAWNGGQEAAHAVAAALPLLKRASEVIVASVGELPVRLESAESVAMHLRMHGVSATGVLLPEKRGENPEETLAAMAMEKKAELLVMGAYSHSRWREMVLGGFTRHMLRHSAIPLFMAR